MVNELVFGGLYQHYKGQKYIVKSLVRHSETLEWLVLYECQYENSAGKIWVRPQAMFMETVLVNGIETPRFKYIGEA